MVGAASAASTDLCERDLVELAEGERELGWLAERTLLIFDAAAAAQAEGALCAAAAVHLLDRPGRDLLQERLGFRLRAALGTRRGSVRTVRGRRGMAGLALGGAKMSSGASVGGVGSSAGDVRPAPFVLDISDANPETRARLAALSSAAYVAIGRDLDPAFARSAGLTLSTRGHGGAREVSEFDHAPAIWSVALAELPAEGELAPSFSLEVFGAGTLLGRTRARPSLASFAPAGDAWLGRAGVVAMTLGLATVCELQLLPVGEALDELPRYGEL